MNMRRASSLAMAWFFAAGFALPAAADDGLGRLFFTPAERALLDAARLAARAADLSAEPTELPPLVVPELEFSAPPPPPAPVTVNGIVARSRGPATVWINGLDSVTHDLSQFTPDSGRLGMRQRAVEIKTPDAGSSHAVKPGQSFDPALGRVVDSYLQRSPTDAATPPAP